MYHVCKDKHSKCKQKLEKGDRRHLIHMDRWRLMSPATTRLGATYLKALGARLGKEQLRAAAEAKDSGEKPPQGGDHWLGRSTASVCCGRRVPLRGCLGPAVTRVVKSAEACRPQEVIARESAWTST